jgi:hypothetical protein
MDKNLLKDIHIYRRIYIWKNRTIMKSEEALSRFMGYRRTTTRTKDRIKGLDRRSVYNNLDHCRLLYRSKSKKLS